MAVDGILQHMTVLPLHSIETKVMEKLNSFDTYGEDEQREVQSLLSELRDQNPLQGLETHYK